MTEHPLDDLGAVHRLQRDNERLRAELAALRASRSWRIGHGLVRIGSRVLGVIGRRRPTSRAGASPRPHRPAEAEPGGRPRSAAPRRPATAERRPLVQLIDPVPEGVTEQLPGGPVFIGGTGRSGTWVLGRLFAAHPRWTTIPSELRFHARPPGIPGVLAGTLPPARFAVRIRDDWARLTGASGHAKGLQMIAAEHEIRAWLNAFVRRAEDDLDGALGQLLLDMAGPWTRGRGAVGWCETTPDNAAAAAALTQVLPTSRVVHVVRDGRDVAASVVAQPWGPDGLDEALDWWVVRLRAAHDGLAASPADQVHTVRLEELIHVDRDRTFDQLCRAVGFQDRAPLQAYFDRRMSADAGNVGRWRRHLEAAEAARFDARYRRAIERLEADGVALPTAPDLVDEIAVG